MVEELCRQKRIYQVKVQPQTLELWEEELEQSRQRWGKYFTNPEQFEFFAMLPLSEEQRQIVLRSMIKEQEFKQDLSTCKGRCGSSEQHRLHCIKCVLTEKPAIAKPLFV